MNNSRKSWQSVSFVDQQNSARLTGQVNTYASPFSNIRGGLSHWYVIYFISLVLLTWSIQASGAHGVTLQNPPKSELFHDFSSHPSLSSKSGVSSPAVVPLVFMTPQAMMGQPYMVPWYMPPALGYPSSYPPTPTPMHQPPPHQQHQAPATHDFPSSDGFDDSYANPYPEIHAFIMKLSEKQPRWQLTKHIADFNEKDYYNIDQLAKITTDHLSGPEFHMTSGNAEFLLDAVHAEIKRINRVHGKKCVWYCPFILFISYPTQISLSIQLPPGQYPLFSLLFFIYLHHVIPTFPTYI